MREGPLRAPVRARARPPHVADDAPHRRHLARGDLGRGDGLRRRQADRDPASKHGQDAIAFISSSRCTNEENYILQKLARAALGTNNIDNCSRVCHSPTSFGLIQSLGESGGTNSFADIDVTSCLFLTGANPTEGHPVVGARMKEARLRGAKLIVADPRRIELAAMADVFLQLRPGTNVALYNGLAHVIVRDGLVDRAFVDARADRADALRRAPEGAYDPKKVEAITGVPAALVEKAAHLYASSSPAAIFYGLGVTEQAQGVSGVRCLANLALLTGNLGKPGAGSNPLRGQNNVQGSSDVGALPTYLTMYRKMADDVVRKEFEAKWGGRPIDPARGLMIPEMFDRAVSGDLKAMYVFGEDIAQTDPNVHHVEKALRALDLLVVHDIFENVTAKFAHVMLPGSSFLEKTGTFTNAERRVQLVREAVTPPGNARRDLDILFDLSKRLGYEMPHAGPSEVMDEIAELTPDWKGHLLRAPRDAGPAVAGARRRSTRARRSSIASASARRAGVRTSSRSTGSRPARARARSSRSSSSRGASSRTTTPARRRGAPATWSSSRRISSRSTRRTLRSSARRTATFSRSRALAARCRRTRASRRAWPRATSSSRSTSPR